MVIVENKTQKERNHNVAGNYTAIVEAIFGNN